MDEVYLKLGIRQLQEKRYYEALDYLNKAKDFNDKNGYIYYYLGNYNYIQKRFNEAYQHYEKAITLKVKLEDCYRKLGMIHKKNAENEKSLEMFNKVLTINPKNYYAYFMKGRIYYDMKNYEESIKNYDLSIINNKDRKFKEGKEGVILAYAGLKQRTVAFDTFKRYFSNEINEPETQAFKARLHWEFNEYSSALSSINYALNLRPNDRSFLGDKIVYLYYLNSFEECVRQGTALINQKRETQTGLKGFYSLLFYVGCACLRERNSTQAEVYFKEYEENVKEVNWKDEYLTERARIQLDTKLEIAIANIDKTLQNNPNCIPALKQKLNYYEIHSETYGEEIKSLKDKLASLGANDKEEYNVVYNEVTESFLVHTNQMPGTNKQSNSSSETISIKPSTNPTQNEDKLDCDFKCIGKGSFGNVYLIQMYTGETVALKRFKSNKITLDAKEKEILQTINHPNIVKYLGFYKKDIQMELCNGGDVFTEIFRKKITLPKRFKYKIIRQIAEALNYLHNKKGIVHSDIKNQNILLDKLYELGQKNVNEFPNAKLCDFGLSKIVHDKENNKKGGSLVYASPEAIKGNELTFKSDIYSFGMTIFELFQEKIPFSDGFFDPEDIVKCVKLGITPNFKKLQFRKEFNTLLQDCCKKNPSERLPIEIVLNQIITLEASDVEDKIIH